MDWGTIEALGMAAGIGGIAIGAFIFISKDLIAKLAFPKLTRDSAVKLVVMFAILSWSIAVLGILAWAYVEVIKKDPEIPEIVDAPNIEDVQIKEKSLLISLEDPLIKGEAAIVSIRRNVASDPILEKQFLGPVQNMQIDILDFANNRWLEPWSRYVLTVHVKRSGIESRQVSYEFYSWARDTTMRLPEPLSETDYNWMRYTGPIDLQGKIQSKNGTIYYTSSKNEHPEVRYLGPIVDSLPNGKGSLKSTSLNCDYAIFEMGVFVKGDCDIEWKDRSFVGLIEKGTAHTFGIIKFCMSQGEYKYLFDPSTEFVENTEYIQKGKFDCNGQNRVIDGYLKSKAVIFDKEFLEKAYYRSGNVYRHLNDADSSRIYNWSLVDENEPNGPRYFSWFSPGYISVGVSRSGNGTHTQISGYKIYFDDKSVEVRSIGKSGAENHITEISDLGNECIKGEDFGLNYDTSYLNDEGWRWDCTSGYCNIKNTRFGALLTSSKINDLFIFPYINDLGLPDVVYISNNTELLLKESASGSGVVGEWFGSTKGALFLALILQSDYISSVSSMQVKIGTKGLAEWYIARLLQSAVCPNIKVSKISYAS